MSDTPDILSGLNTAQRAAVVHDSGPLMVLAGPGTGKTRVITHRVAHLIRERGVDPENIVAVTYTVKAAKQLRERLHELVGEVAEGVHAHTFHGLGYRLIRRFADVIDLPPPSMTTDSGGGGGIMDSAQERRLLRAIITRHNLFPHARAAGLDSAVDQVSRAVAVLADAAISNDDARAFISAARVRLVSGRGMGDRTLDAAALDAEKARVDRLADIITAAEHFEHARRASGTLSYADLITLPTRILVSSPHAAAIIRDEYRHIVVDEFQDVNIAQIRLLQAIAPPEKSPDLCIVGDDDQSIYEFRGADDRAFARFAALWTGAAQIELSENYRSARVVIDAANSIIARATARFAPDKRITEPAKPDPARNAGASVRCIQLRDDKLDGETIAAMLLLDRGESGESPPRPWKSFAVVCRSHTDAARVKDAFDIEGIPALVARTGAAAEDEGVKDVFAWIQAIVRPRLTHSVVRLLVRPPFSAPLAKVQQWERAYRARLSRFEAANGEGFDELTGTDPGGFVDFLAANHAEDAHVARLAAWHDEFRTFNASHAAAETIFRIITATDPAHADLLPARERARRVSDLVTLVRFARERQARLDEPGDLRAFWSYYEDLSEHDQKLGDSAGGTTDERIDGAPGALGASGSSAEDDAPDAVRIITAHSAKGLEFDTVFVPRVSPSYGYGKSGSSDDGPDFPDGLIVRDLPGNAAGGLSDKERRLAEERRVFYVACTRAERRLVLLAKKNKSRSKSTHFFEEIVHDSTPDLAARIQVLVGDEQLKEAARAGLGRSIAAERTALDEEAMHFVLAQVRREVFDRARREIRTRAAAALDHAAGPDASPDRADESGAVLRDAAARLAALAYAQAHDAPPAWAAERNVGEYIRTILERAGSADASSAASARAALIIPRPPLDLSYTVIDQYERCPRCYYLRHVLGLDPLPGAAQVVGSAVHEAMEKFANQCRAAEGEGQPAPGVERLLELGRRAFFRRWPRGEEVDRMQLDQISAQLALAFERLHDPNANILEIEKLITFSYSAAAAPDIKHKFVAKIDRIDQIAMEDGSTGFRIIDYKSGKSWESLKAPKADNLQLGIYALALAHLYGSGDPARDRFAGSAEYWLLSTGERGVLPLISIKHDRIRARIDEAIEGILAGRFDKNPKCEGECDLLGADTDALR